MFLEGQILSQKVVGSLGISSANVLFKSKSTGPPSASHEGIEERQEGPGSQKHGRILLSLAKAPLNAWSFAAKRRMKRLKRNQGKGLKYRKKNGFLDVFLLLGVIFVRGLESWLGRSLDVLFDLKTSKDPTN